MDYKEKYENALEWMREVYPTMEGFVKEDAEHVFPELKEIEDERIRTRLIALVEAFGQGNYKDEMLAYLEKQKDEAKRQFNLGVQAGREEALYEIEKQKEQKPAEWSEKDEMISEHELKVLKLVAEKDGTCLMGLYNKLKSLRLQPHWKPSEEQMEALQNSAYGTYQNGDGPALRELYNDLKKL